MAIDASIALGVKPLQIESPVNQMAKMYEMQNAVQSNQLNKMKMDEYSRGIATTQRRNALLGGFTSDMSVDDQVNKLVQGGFLDEAKSLAESASKVNADKRLGRTAELDAISKTHGIYKSAMGSVMASPTLANAINTVRKTGRMLGEDVEDDVAELTALGENPDAIRQWAAGIALEADKLLPKTDKLDLEGSVQDRTIDPLTGIPKVIGTTQKTIAPSSGIPKLKPGEVWDPAAQTVKQVPGSAEYNKQSKAHGTDYNAAKTVLSKMDNAISKVNEILDPKNASGFENNFGGYNAAVSRMFTGNTATVRKNIDSLKADMKGAGLELIRAGGSIGALTEREWPMLEAQIDAIDYMLDEDAAKAAFERVKSTFNRIKDQAKDTYQTTWGETQYYKPEVNKGAPPSPPGKRNAKDEADYQAWLKSQQPKASTR
jgi:hypothetical protein